MAQIQGQSGADTGTKNITVGRARAARPQRSLKCVTIGLKGPLGWVGGGGEGVNPRDEDRARGPIGTAPFLGLTHPSQ
jgi:hypothetical protein